jgi:hypothetical protein
LLSLRQVAHRIVEQRTKVRYPHIDEPIFVPQAHVAPAEE